MLDTTSSDGSRRWLVRALTLVAACGALLGLAGCGGRNKEDCIAITNEIKARAATDTTLGPRQPCGSREVAGADAPGYEAQCSDLRACLDEAGL